MHMLFQKITSFFKHHFIWKLVFYYVLVVVFFALVNYNLFWHNSTSFLLSDQLNKHIDRYIFGYQQIDIAKYHEDAKDAMPITIGAFNEMAHPILDELDSIYSVLEYKRQYLNDSSVQLDSISDKASEMMSDSIRVFKDKMLAECKYRIDSLEHLLIGQDSTEMIIQGKYVELAQLRYELAKKNVDVQSYVIEHYGSFMPDSLSNEILERNSAIISLSSDITDTELSRMALTHKMQDLANSFHQNRLNSVSFWDFLYYSICVSTTVNFGDIAPNSGVARFVAIIELLLCLGLVGIIVDRITRKFNEEKSKNN